MRAALGARRTRLVRQFLTENLLLVIASAIVGLLLAVWGTHVLVTLSPPDLPRSEAIRVDFHVVLFLLGASTLASFASGLAPAMQASAVNLSDALKQGGRTTTEGTHANRLRSFLVASEFALALMLLISAGLMVRSFFALQSVDPGFNPHNVVSMAVSVAGSKEAEDERRTIFYRELLERIRTRPGVESAAGINHLPLGGDLWIWPFVIAGRPAPRPGESPAAVYRIVTPGYFQTMRLPLVRGRDITFADNLGSPGVVIINERAAQTYWPGEDPLGKRISFRTTHDGEASSTVSWLTVVGIAKNAKQGDWASAPDPEVYLAAFQNREFLTDPQSHSAYLTLVVRSSGDPGALVSAVKQAVWSIDRNLPISEVVTMDSVVREANSQPQFEMLLLAIFAVLALVLAAVGIYGVMSYSVSRRTQEIGIRISLGASRADVLQLVLREGMILALLGSTVGLVGALLLSRFMSKLLYGVAATDPVTFLGVAMLLSTVALVATYVPAQRATRVNLMVALRCE